jgi:hypothetical protein
MPSSILYGDEVLSLIIVSPLNFQTQIPAQQKSI